jgi:hypothetical protein
MVGLDTAELINLIFVALLVGNDVAVWSVVHPALDTIPVREGFLAERAMLLRYKVQVPFLILFILASGIAVAVPKNRQAALRIASELLENAKKSGLVRRALDAAGFSDADIAPPAG